MVLITPKSTAQYNYRLIGEMLIEAGLISVDQLTEVLYEQKFLNLRLGETLLHKGLITPAQLDEYLSKQAILNSHTYTIERLNPVNGYYLQKLLQKAITQGMTQLELGKVAEVIEQGVARLPAWELIKLEHLIALHQSCQSGKADYKTLTDLEKQTFNLLKIELTTPVLDEPISDESILLGEMLIRKQMITQEQLQSALIEQRYTKHRLGQILIQHKLLNFDQLDQLLWEQATTEEA